MTRARRALLGAVAVVTALVVAMVVIDDEELVDPYLQFVTAHLDMVGHPAPVRSDAKFSRNIAKFTDLDSVDPALNACAGPVAVYLGDGYPILVAEHDYCGGSAWMPKLEAADVVHLTGPGVPSGLYRAETIRYVPRYDSTLRDMPDGDVVLQTCISRKTMVLVGLQLAART